MIVSKKGKYASKCSGCMNDCKQARRMYVRFCRNYKPIKKEGKK